MLKDLPARVEGLKENLRPFVNCFFNDDLMMGAAAVLAAAVIAPLFFSFTQSMLRIFESVNLLVVALFLAEYSLKVFVAESRYAYVKNPWHILDLFIIVLALLDILELDVLPLAVSGGRYSPILRLLQLLFAFLLTGRTVERVLPEPAEKMAEIPASRLLVSALGEDWRVRSCSKEDLSSMADREGGRWIDLQNIGGLDLDWAAEAISIPRFILESKLLGESFPGIDFFDDFTTIFLWDSRLDPSEASGKNVRIVKNGTLVICKGTWIYTLCTGVSDLFERVSSDVRVFEGNLAMSILYSILRHKMKDYEEIVRAIELKTLELEEVPVKRTTPEFLEDVFHLKKEIQSTVNNLWHFKQVLGYATARKVAIQGFGDEHIPYWNLLSAEAEYMYETAQNIRESLLSLIELHINTVSYDINRVMKVLAVITCLAVVPTIIGGLLGVNLIDVPYDLTIMEVFSLIISIMLLGLYAFYKMGWVR